VRADTLQFNYEYGPYYGFSVTICELHFLQCGREAKAPKTKMINGYSLSLEIVSRVGDESKSMI